MPSAEGESVLRRELHQLYPLGEAGKHNAEKDRGNQMSVENPPEEAIDVKGAVATATQYALKLYDQNIQDILLEEVELVNDQVWNVTLSFTRPSENVPPPFGGLEALVNPQGRTSHKRHYRVFLIDAKTGKVRAMKLRDNG